MIHPWMENWSPEALVSIVAKGGGCKRCSEFSSQKNPQSKWVLAGSNSHAYGTFSGAEYR